MPVEILPFILGSCFLLIWVFIAWVKFLEHSHAARREREARHIVEVRKVGPPRTRVDHAAG